MPKLISSKSRTSHNGMHSNGRGGILHYYQNRLTDRLEDIKESLAELTENIKDKTSDAISHTLKNAKDQTMQMKKKMNRLVTQKPYKSLGVVLLTGIVLGYWMKK